MLGTVIIFGILFKIITLKGSNFLFGIWVLIANIKMSERFGLLEYEIMFVKDEKEDEYSNRCTQ